MTHEAIIQTQRAETLARMAGERLVLVIQDTTSLDFSAHPSTVGLGPLDSVHSRGFFAPSTLAVRATGVPLGVLGQQVWVRAAAAVGKRATRHERPWVDKDSYKWVKGLPTPAAPGEVGQRGGCATRKGTAMIFWM